MDESYPLSRRNYYIAKAIMAGADMFTAIETVASTAIEHPEWNMTETRSWKEWERDQKP